MRPMFFGFAIWAACCAGRSTHTDGQVHEVEPGTFNIGIDRGGATLFSSGDKQTVDEAVRKAGDYCHSEGQKLLVKAVSGNSLVFACTPDDSKSAVSSADAARPAAGKE